MKKEKVQVSLISEFSLLATGNVADAARSVVRVMDSGIRPLALNMKMIGPAFTVECCGGNNLAIVEAISIAPTGCVLVATVQGHMKAGHVGDVLSHAAKIRGIVGIVLDGACRDVDEVIQMNYPLFARGSNPQGPLKLKNGKINQPIACGGITVNPGDMIFADASGVVVFPVAKSEYILEKAKAIAVKETQILKSLHEGKSLRDIFGLHIDE